MFSANPTWHLLGAGSLGSLFAVYLQRAGVPLELIMRDEESARELHRNGGITLMHDGTEATVAINASLPTTQTPIHNLLVCTKAQQTLDAIKTIRSRLAPNAVIVLLQNGMGVRELLQRDLSINGLNDVVILHALSTEGAFRTGRFHVTHAGLGETVIGAIDTAQHSIAQHITQTLQCGRPIRCVSDIQDRLWLKLAVNSVINPLTALHRCRNGELLQLPNFDAIVSKLCAELAMVARAEHIALNDERMREEIYRVTQMTAHNKSSMLQDIEAGRPTEIDFINGFIVERAQAHALPCREHADLLNAVRALQP